MIYYRKSHETFTRLRIRLWLVVTAIKTPHDVSMGRYDLEFGFGLLWV